VGNRPLCLCPDLKMLAPGRLLSMGEYQAGMKRQLISFVSRPANTKFWLRVFPPPILEYF
jgi:hypothetical protein